MKRLGCLLLTVDQDRRHDDNPEPEGVVFEIQRWSGNDGPGIRTVIFFKGCPLRCIWCCNPESWSPVPRLPSLKIDARIAGSAGRYARSRLPDLAVTMAMGVHQAARLAVDVQKPALLPPENWWERECRWETSCWLSRGTAFSIASRAAG